MKEPPPQTYPFSVRLTLKERAQAERKAGCMPLGSYIRFLVLGDDAPINRTRGKRPVGDQEALGRVLAALGASRIANNLNQLAKAANSGSLPITPETEAILQETCAAILSMRDDLMQALGSQPESTHDPERLPTCRCEAIDESYPPG